MKLPSKKALDFYRAGNFAEALTAIETDIEQSPDASHLYLYLGLMSLLNLDEEMAQASWMYGFSLVEQQQEWEKELVGVLTDAAIEQETQENYAGALLLRWHLQEFQPQNVWHRVKIVDLQCRLNEFDIAMVETLDLCNLLSHAQPEDALASLLQSVLPRVLDCPSPLSVKFADACVGLIHSDRWIELVVKAAFRLSDKFSQHESAIALLKRCLAHFPQNLTALEYLARCYLKAKQHTEAIQTAQLLLHCSTNLPAQVVARLLLLDARIGACEWRDVLLSIDETRSEVLTLVESHPVDLSLATIQSLVTKSNLFLYLQDDLAKSRMLQNCVGQVFHDNIVQNTPVQIPLFTHIPSQSRKRIKVGYLGSTFYRHSVGWLCRWLFQYHDREKFHISLYTSRKLSHLPFFQSWFAQRVDSYFEVDGDVTQLAEKIRDDEIDILVDLDSVTLTYSCLVLSLKPAPIQISWLGMDAAGIPSIDYFIADPYVLPDGAEGLYREKILRLPSTYIAVDGFESHAPTLRRDQLDIPNDAVVYLSSQSGYKRFPDTVRLQLKILKAVPNSYFLIKGLSASEKLQELFVTMAAEEGIDSKRLRFLPMVEDECTHRANLRIADVVLDTYPYNGATTTLETLWMEIPMVTRVGQQFTARNSYAFLTNVGVSEGIAWSDEEYIEWGVRLGTDSDLRNKVAMRMRESKKDSPLWNSRQFTLEMETTYQKIYSNYLSAK